MNLPLRLKGARNFRDFGGQVTRDGRRVKRHRLFRSEALNQLTYEDYSLLGELGIGLVCDLRSDLERSHKPTSWPLHVLPKTLVMDVDVDLRVESCALSDALRADPSERGALAMMLQAYRFIPVALTRHLSNLFTALAAEEQAPLIVHCSAGKDRTGVLSALLLLLLGVPRQQVLADYLQTNQQIDSVKLESDLARQLELVTGRTPSPEMVKVIAGVREIYLETAIDSIESRHGTVEAYFSAAGVAREQIQAFRHGLIE